MTVVVERRRARAQYLGAGALALVVLVALAPVVAPFGLPVLLVAPVLVPLGTAYGVVVQSVLAVRRRTARRQATGPVGGSSAEEARAAAFGFRVQTVERCLSIALLAALPVLVIAVLADLLGGVSPAEGSPSALQAYGLGTASEILAAVTAAIPVAAVVSTVRVRSTPILLGEARAVTTRTGAHERIRRAHLLSRCAYGVYLLGGVAVVSALVGMLVR